MFDLKLSGKAAIVTGGSAGIGLACAKALFTEGTKIILTLIDANHKNIYGIDNEF